MTDKAICRNDGRCEYAIQTGAEKEGNCPAGKCAMPGPGDKPAAHLTIPGALEWDGDNGTHGADGESRAHSESAAAIATLKGLGYTHHGGQLWKPPVGQKPGFDLIDDLRAQLANTEQSRRSFFDLSQDLEKRLAYMVEAMNQIVQVSSMYEKPFEIATLAIGELSAMVIAPASPAEIDPFAATEAPYMPLSAAEVEAFMSMGDRK